MTSMKKKILSDAEVDGSVSINGDLTLTQVSNGILVADQNGTVSVDSSIDFDELHALDGYDIESGTIEERLTDLDGKIEQEISDRTEADSDLQDTIDALDDKIDQEILDRATAVSAEATARQNADTTLQTNITAEVTRATTAEAGLQADITTEATARQSADTTLQGNIDAEAAARGSADATLQANITAEATARQSADSTLQGNIDTEVAARQSADTTLQANITAEATARSTADSTLDARTTALESGKAPVYHAGQDSQQDPYPYGKASAQAYGHVQFDASISGDRTDVTVSEKGIKDFVNSSINALAAYYITKNAAGDPFATHAELMASTTVYSSGSPRVPTRNDYCIIIADETNGGGDSTRYTYNSDSTTYSSANWAYQYTFNKQFTAAQLAALDSGITVAKVGIYDTHVSNANIHVTTQNKTDWDAKYDKPSAGIPKTDLAQSVQDSLGLADSSLQAHQPIKTINSTTMVGTGNINLQVPLVDSGTGQNIKTVGGTNILGTGDIPFPTVVNSNPSLTWATKSKVGSVGSTDLEVTMPSNPVIKTAIESALGVSSTYNDQALIVKDGVIDFGEAGKVDDVQINGTTIVANKTASIHIGDGLAVDTNVISHDLSGVTVGSYQEVTVDQMGHVTHGKKIFTFTHIYLEEVD